MHAVVLAAGDGTRLRPLTNAQPKGMVDVAGDPLLTHCFDRLLELGADELVVVGYLKEVIIDHYGDEYEGVPSTYAHSASSKGSRTRCSQSYAATAASRGCSPSITGIARLFRTSSVPGLNASPSTATRAPATSTSGILRIGEG